LVADFLFDCSNKISFLSLSYSSRCLLRLASSSRKPLVLVTFSSIVMMRGSPSKVDCSCLWSIRLSTSFCRSLRFWSVETRCGSTSGSEL
jgi:hypothetical protein